MSIQTISCAIVDEESLRETITLLTSEGLEKLRDEMRKFSRVTKVEFPIFRDNTVTTPVNVTGAPVTNIVANHAKKPKKFNLQNFKRWQQMMFFYLTTLNRARFLNKTAPQVEPPMEEVRGSSFLDHKMVDSKNVITQAQDLQVLLHDIHVEGMTLSETFQVAYIIEKRQQVSSEKQLTPDSAKANMVEHPGSSLKSNSKGKGKRKNAKKIKGKAEYLAPKAGIRMTPRQANMVNDNVDMITIVSDVIAMISEVNLVGSNNSDWWVDTRATHHVCADKSMFHSFGAVDN
ncbi:hypothetical protein Tco_0553624 [Tanacetum coccineum]